MHRHLHLPLLHKESGLFALLVTHVVHIQKQIHTHRDTHVDFQGLSRHRHISSHIRCSIRFFGPNEPSMMALALAMAQALAPVPRSPSPLPLPVDCSFGCANSFWCCSAAASASRRPSIHLKCNSKFFPLLQQLKLTGLPSPSASSHPVHHAACQKVHFRQQQRPLCNDSIASGRSPGRSPSWRAHI